MTWLWGPEKDKVFAIATTELIYMYLNVLAHYDSKSELTLAWDASPYEVGAILSHIMDNGLEQPVAYTSRSLSPAKQKYT